MELKLIKRTRRRDQIILLIVLNGIEIGYVPHTTAASLWLLIVLNGIEIDKRGRHELRRGGLLIVLNGIEIGKNSCRSIVFHGF